MIPKFITEVLVRPSSHLINRLVADTDLLDSYGVSVLGIARPGAEETVLAPGPYNRIRSDDTLIIQGEPDSILRLRKDLDLALNSAREVEAPMPVTAQVREMVQTLIGNGYTDCDFAALLELQAKASGHELVSEDADVGDGLD